MKKISFSFFCLTVLCVTTLFAAKDKTFNSVPLPKDDQLPGPVRKTLGELPPLNVYRMLANVPNVFPEYIDLVKALFNKGNLDRRLRQIVILRQSHLLQCEYEWHQQVLLAETNGVTTEEIETIASENPVVSLTEEENFLCQLADEITLKARLTDESFHKLFNLYSIEIGTEIILTLSYTNMLGRFINATRVPLEKTNPLEGHSSPTN